MIEGKEGWRRGGGKSRAPQLERRRGGRNKGLWRRKVERTEAGGGGMGGICSERREGEKGYAVE